MRIEQLQAFLKVAKLGSFQKAALEFNLTQSTISRQIQALETELNCQLFHRATQVKLTVAGELLLRRAGKICQEWDIVTGEINNLFQGQQTELCVAAVHSVCVSHLPALLPKFCQNHPQTQLRVTALGSDRALKVLQDGLVDVAIVMSHRRLAKTKELVINPLYEERIAVLMAHHHPLGKKTEVNWQDLALFPQVVFKDGYQMRQLIEEEFIRRQIPLNISLELNVPEAFYGVVENSQMLAIMPESLLNSALNNPAFTVLNFASDALSGSKTFCRQISVVTTVDRLQIPAIADFFDLVTERLTSSTVIPGSVE